MPETTTTPHVQRYSPIPGWGLELELRVLRVPNLLYGVIGGGFTSMANARNYYDTACTKIFANTRLGFRT